MNARSAALVLALLAPFVLGAAPPPGPLAPMWETSLEAAAPKGGAQLGALTTTSDGGVVLAGWTVAPLGAGALAGGRDGFLQVYGGDGSLVWTFTFGTSEDDAALALAADDAGGFFVGGASEGNLAATTHDRGYWFVSHYDLSRKSTWTVKFGVDPQEPAGVFENVPHMAMTVHDDVSS